MKFAFLVLLLTAIPTFGNAKDSRIEVAVNLIHNMKVITTDSGKTATEDFIRSCIRSISSTYYVIQCDDVLWVHHISFYGDNSGSSEFVLITADGASVEKRWVFFVNNDEYLDVLSHTWPEISRGTIGRLLREKTGDEKYSEEYVLSVAHSSYRVNYSSTGVRDVLSGIPDQSWGIKLGEIRWNGERFIFIPNPS